VVELAPKAVTLMTTAGTFEYTIDIGSCDDPALATLPGPLTNESDRFVVAIAQGDTPTFEIHCYDCASGETSLSSCD